MPSAGPDKTPSRSLPVSLDLDLSRFVLPELLLSVFDWLPQKDLLSATASCRRWRALAFSHPGFYYHLELVVHGVDWTPLHTFCARLRYLRERNLRASVVVDWSLGLTTDPAGILCSRWMRRLRWRYES
ncbi:hypothetical protein EXIGLDRAFT_394196 [Exidia glandulosa HHB12029]|uniref:F-box domain-containing protein n=1 Tax=Exidia glandulosa HHB12029 TaxID=1314781 RepID=A0A165BQM2_EXIGL|nr:hypothetical protein EXIGLDRAFT_394196 [Exidia glandulosa HHB12029]